MQNYSLANRGPGDISQPAPDRIIEGDPVFTTWSFTETPIATGLWAATPGRHLVIRDQQTWEQFHILEGEIILTAEGGAPESYKAGDIVHILPGYRGEWQTVSPVLKHYITVQL